MTRGRAKYILFLSRWVFSDRMCTMYMFYIFIDIGIESVRGSLGEFFFKRFLFRSLVCLNGRSEPYTRVPKNKRTLRNGGRVYASTAAAKWKSKNLKGLDKKTEILLI